MVSDRIPIDIFLHSICLELFRKNIVIQGQTAIPEASFPGKKQIRPHHFCHSGPFATHISIETEATTAFPTLLFLADRVLLSCLFLAIGNNYCAFN
jgi:hypothetical protein